MLSIWKGYYQQKGYIDFAIESATAELNTERDGFILKFVVNEGKRYSINTITLNDTLTSVDKQDIFDEIDQSADDYYNRTAVRKNEEDMVLFLSEKGYPFVDVQTSVKKVDSDEIDLISAKVFFFSNFQSLKIFHYINLFCIFYKIIIFLIGNRVFYYW